MIELDLPFPPSVNHYYRHVGPRTLISREGRKYRERVGGIVRSAGQCIPPTGGRIALMMDAFPPDRRRRNLDNLLKSTLDALQHAGAYQDDSQIDLLIVQRREPRPLGMLRVVIQDLPLLRCPHCGREN